MIKLKLSIIYSWSIRTLTYFLPNHPLFMRLRGFLYSLMMEKCGKNFQVSSSVIFNSLSGICIGNNVYIAPNNVFIGTNIHIEDNVILGPCSVYSGGNHQFDGSSFRLLPSISQGPLIIQEGAWVAANCTLTTGSVLPRFSVLAAGAVLNQAMAEEMAIYGGIPAKKIGDVHTVKACNL